MSIMDQCLSYEEAFFKSLRPIYKNNEIKWLSKMKTNLHQDVLKLIDDELNK